MGKCQDILLLFFFFSSLLLSFRPACSNSSSTWTVSSGPKRLPAAHTVSSASRASKLRSCTFAFGAPSGLEPQTAGCQIAIEPQSVRPANELPPSVSSSHFALPLTSGQLAARVHFTQIRASKSSQSLLLARQSPNNKTSKQENCHPRDDKLSPGFLFAPLLSLFALCLSLASLWLPFGPEDS